MTLMIQPLWIFCCYIPFNELLPTSLCSLCFMIPNCSWLILSCDFYSIPFCLLSSSLHTVCWLSLKILNVILWMWIWFAIVRIPYREPVWDRELINGNLTGSTLCLETWPLVHSCVPKVVKIDGRTHGILWETISCCFLRDVRCASDNL